MANYTATARTNYFKVRDLEALEEALEPFEIQVVRNTEQPDLVALLCQDSDGAGWPSYYYDDNDDNVDVEIPQLVAEHLEPGHVAVFIEAGAEKLRYVTGHAIALNHEGDTRQISLSDIYAMAGELGEHVTSAEY